MADSAADKPNTFTIDGREIDIRPGESIFRAARRLERPAEAVRDAIVQAMQNALCDVAGPLRTAGIGFRVVSYDLRRGEQVIPEPPGGRHALYVGTGGPGHLDPRMNDGASEGSQGIDEDPAWEPRLFALFDRIRASEGAALLSVSDNKVVVLLIVNVVLLFVGTWVVVLVRHFRGASASDGAHGGS